LATHDQEENVMATTRPAQTGSGPHRLETDATGRAILPPPEVRREWADSALEALDALDAGPPATAAEREEDFETLGRIDAARGPGERKLFGELTECPA
jgi:hypothetical protein